MPVDLQSYSVIGDKPLNSGKLLVDLRKIVDLLNKVEARGVTHEAQITNVQQIVQTTVMSGGMAPPTPIGPFPPVVVSATGALSGDGSATSPLAVRVDGTTVQINASNQLEVIAGASGITQLTGDVTAGPGIGSQVATLANSGVAAGTYGSATAVPVFTVDVKGRVTAVTNTGITGLLSGLTSPRVPYAASSTTLADNAAFNWDNANTRLFVPTIVGGTGTTDDLIFQATSGVGAAGSWIFFKVGNNGAVTAMEIDDVGGVGIGTTGLVTVDTALVVRKANPPDIGFVAKFFSNLTAYLQIKSGTGANEQAGFSLFQNTNTFEWRVAVIGNDGNALRFGAGTGGTDVKAYITQRGNLILDATRTEPTTGTKTLVIGDGTVPATMGTDTAALYANDVAGTVNLFAINEAGNASQLTGFTSGSVIFANSVGGFSQDNTNFFWDTATPAFRLLSTHTFLKAATTSGFPTAAANELLISTSNPAGNVLAVKNSNTGPSAYTARGADGNEYFAAGYGNPGLSVVILQDTTYIESWSGTDSAADPKRFIILMDGNYGPSGSGVRFYQRQSFEINGDIKMWELIPSTATQHEGLWFDATNLRLGIGYNNGVGPQNKIHAVDGNIQIDNFNAVPGALLIRTAGGTVSSITQTPAATTVFALQGRGYTDAAAYTSNIIAVNGVAVVAPTATDQESRLDFRVMPAGSVTLRTVLQLSGAAVLIPTNVMLKFVGLTSAEVGLKRSGTTLQTRLADDSLFAQHSALEFMNNRANFLMRTAVSWTNGAASNTATLTNAPAATNPTKWIPVDDNGVTRYIPAW